MERLNCQPMVKRTDSGGSGPTVEVQNAQNLVWSGTNGFHFSLAYHSAFSTPWA
jgi:hypothetical protein